MRPSISLISQWIPKMCVRLSKLQPWLQVPTIVSLGNLWSFVRKMLNWQNWLTGSNFEQVSSAPVTIALFTDTDLAKRARKIARVGGANNFSEEQLQYFMKNLPAEFARYNEQQVSDYLALNAGLVAMNLILALTDKELDQI